jgi:flagellar operon protein
VDIKKVSNFENMIPSEKGPNIKAPQGTGPSFQDMLNSVQSGFQQTPGVTQPQQVVKSQAGFAKAVAEPVKFSNHAVERMQTRGISFNKADLERLNEAVGRAAAKGSKDTLVLMNDSALIVSVKNKTVVTVMDQAALKENVFTNIDSTIVM